MITVSIVIPCKNAEAHISRCLDSLITNGPAQTETEIILADCASNDATISIAGRYPVKILRLEPEWPHSASAARYIGSRFAQGEFIFFMDTDMRLEKDFLTEALARMKADCGIAGIGGIGREVYLKNGKETGSNRNLYRTAACECTVGFLGGAGLYRDSVLREAGSFNPWLHAAEEYELAQRIRARGYRLLSIPKPMITHYTAEIGEWREFLRKKRMKLFFGIGQSLRLSHSFRYLIEGLFYYKEFSIFLLFLLYECAAAAVFHDSRFLVVSAALAAPLLVLFACLLFKKKDCAGAGLGIIKWFSIGAEIIRGFLMPVQDSRRYPGNPRIITGNISNPDVAR